MRALRRTTGRRAAARRGADPFRIVDRRRSRRQSARHAGSHASRVPARRAGAPPISTSARCGRAAARSVDDRCDPRAARRVLAEPGNRIARCYATFGSGSSPPASGPDCGSSHMPGGSAARIPRPAHHPQDARRRGPSIRIDRRAGRTAARSATDRSSRPASRSSRTGGWPISCAGTAAFGLTLVRLDVRQHAERHTSALDAHHPAPRGWVLRRMDRRASNGVPDRTAPRSLASGTARPAGSRTDEVADVLDTFETIADISSRVARAPTSSRWPRRLPTCWPSPACSGWPARTLRIVPLFEQVDDAPRMPPARCGICWRSPDTEIGSTAGRKSWSAIPTPRRTADGSPRTGRSTRRRRSWSPSAAMRVFS